MMNIRLCTYIVLIATFFACGDKKEVSKTSSNTIEATQKDSTIEITKSSTLEEKIAAIKSNFLMIEKQLSSLEKKEVEEFVGGGVTKREGYFKDGVPKKLAYGNYGEHGSEVHTFYFNNNELFFVLEEEYSEASMQGPFTKKDIRYYIHDGQLIRVLEKEKTVKSGEIDTSDAQNVDVTDQWKSKPNVVSELENIFHQESASLTEAKTIGLNAERWISTDDANAGIEIKNGRFYMFHKIADKIVTTAYDYELDEKDGIEYLTLKNDNGDKIIYGLLEYSDESMVLSYLDRGSTLTYKKEK
ncbi:hypothetical protein [Kordia sp.]|uniref:hypothetical protein n=1 Tax=Kordia sp. TaxID=1965332 RepID=UPI003B597A83